MMRWDIINHLIRKHAFTSYLEIGYFKGWSFDQVACLEKTAVDPAPCKTPFQESYMYGVSFQDNQHLIYKQHSDLFFALLDKNKKYQIIFIDGYHEAKQVVRDVENSLAHLTGEGILVLHDCNPPLQLHTTTGDAGGSWTGDVYKAFINLRMDHFPQAYVVDTDWGCGVLKKSDWREAPEKRTEEKFHPFEEQWKFFDQNRTILLNLISVEEFLKRNE